MMTRTHDDPFRELMRKAFAAPGCAAAVEEDARRRDPGKRPTKHEHKRRSQAA